MGCIHSGQGQLEQPQDEQEEQDVQDVLQPQDVQP